ncbi:MAG: phosphogluconate dehydrogenase (NAD(+)-dependent, decarboxylating) [Hyphomicrobiales bacterium]
MELGIVGLGRMGKNMAFRLLKGKHRVVGYDRAADAVAEVKAEGGVDAKSLEDLVAKLTDRPRAVWCMVPSGDATEQTIRAVAALLSPGDIVIDGGNSYYKDSIARGRYLADRKIHFVDAGTSGGIWGLAEGYCLMVGGDPDICRRLEPILTTLAPPDGYARVGGIGTGHLVKMVHNGVEYGMMQAYAEGFEILKASPENLDLAQIAEVWRHGSVVRSWLLDLAADALKEDPQLSRVADYVADSGEGRWTVMESVERAVPAPVLTLALQARFRSRQESSFGGKLLAALRNKFGGHAVKTA